MCKCCQYYLESCYWHCFEKHFCYDETIALYEDEINKEEVIKREEKNNNGYDNLAFYDNVAIIANRAIFNIEAPVKPATPEIITQQPQKRIKWRDTGIYTNPPSITIEQPTIISIDSPISLATITEEEISGSPKKSDELILQVPKIRKKSLHERRVSKSLTLEIHKHEVPIIRQHSFPKFYLDTPQENQTDSSIMRTPVLALETPVPSSSFNFDLRSVVQIEIERNKRHHESLSAHGHKENNRLGQIKEKLKPLKMLRSASSNSLHSNP